MVSEPACWDPIHHRLSKPLRGRRVRGEEAPARGSSELTPCPPQREDFVRICRELNRLGARYVVVGGFAARDVSSRYGLPGVGEQCSANRRTWGGSGSFSVGVGGALGGVCAVAPSAAGHCSTLGTVES